MATLAQLHSYSAARRQFEAWLLEHSLTAAELARRINRTASQVSVALWSKEPTFTAWRTRLLIERETGLELWTPAAETQRLASIGARLRLDLVADKLSLILATARKKEIPSLPKSGVAANAGTSIGFVTFRALTHHFFPQSSTEPTRRRQPKKTA